MDGGLGGGIGILGASVEGAQGPSRNGPLGEPLGRPHFGNNLGTLCIRHRHFRCCPCRWRDSRRFGHLLGKARSARHRRFGDRGVTCRWLSQRRPVRADLASVRTMAPPESMLPSLLRPTCWLEPEPAAAVVEPTMEGVGARLESFRDRCAVAALPKVLSKRMEAVVH